MATDRLVPDPFSVRAGSDDDDYVIAVYGEVDALTAPELSHEIDRGLESDAAQVVVDMSALRFIDSTGLHALVVAWRRAEERGKRLQLLRPPAPVFKAFEVTGLAGELPFSA